jgi:hypothetical protein
MKDPYYPGHNVIDTDYDNFMIMQWCLDYEEKNKKKEYVMPEPKNEQVRQYISKMSENREFLEF